MPSEPPIFAFASPETQTQIQPSAFASNTNIYTNTNTIIDSSTPFLAASDGNLPLFQQSLSHLSIDATISDTNGLTPLHSAASYNQIHVMKWILTNSSQSPSQNNNKVDVNARDSDGDTPLHHCDHVEAARILVELGNADFMMKNEDGYTALQVKEEELKEILEDDDGEDSDDEDCVNLKKLIEYLREIENLVNTNR